MSHTTSDTDVEEALAEKARNLLQEWTKLNLDVFAQWKYDYAQILGLKPKVFMDPLYDDIDNPGRSVMTTPITWRTKRFELPKMNEWLSGKLVEMEPSWAEHSVKGHKNTAWETVLDTAIQMEADTWYWHNVVHAQTHEKSRSIYQEYTQAVSETCSEERSEHLKRKFLKDWDQIDDDIWKEWSDLQSRWKERLEDNWRASMEESLANANLGTASHSTQRALLLLPYPPIQPMVDTLASGKILVDYDTDMNLVNYNLAKENVDSREKSLMGMLLTPLFETSQDSADPSKRERDVLEIQGLFHLCNSIKRRPSEAHEEN